MKTLNVEQAKEYWQSWVTMPQTKEYLKKLEVLKLDMLTSTMHQPPEHRSDTVAGAIGIQGAIDLILNLKEQAKE